MHRILHILVVCTLRPARTLHLEKMHSCLTRLACWMTASMSPPASACGALLPASCCAAAASNAPLPAGAAAAEVRMLDAVVSAPVADSMLAVPPGCTHTGKFEGQDAVCNHDLPTIRSVSCP